MMRNGWFWLSLGVGGPVGLYLLCLVGLYVFQNLLLFAPPDFSVSGLREEAIARKLRQVPLTASDGTALMSLHHPSEGPRSVLYFHGNAGSVLDDLELKTRLQQEGWDVLSVGYRGYPGSSGAPSEQGMRLDALASYYYAVDDLNIPPEHVVFHGRSMGGGVVGTIMNEVPVGGLVFESTFTAAVDRAAELYPFFPVRWLMKSPFNTKRQAAGIDKPVWIVHSDADEVIPVAHGRALNEAFSNVQYREVSGVTHNQGILDEPKMWTEYLNFINSVARREIDD